MNIVLYTKEDDKERFKKYSLINDYIFIKGIIGNDFLKEFNEIKKNANYKYLPIHFQKYFQKNKSILRTPGQFGHNLSFIKILKYAIKNNLPKITIYEFDVYFHKNFNNELKKYREIIEKSKLFYLGCSQKRFDFSKINNKPYYHPKETDGTFAIIIDKSIYKEYLYYLEFFLLPSDMVLWYIQERYYDECFVANPNLVIADLTKSSIKENRDQEIYSKKFNWYLPSFHFFP